MSEHTPRYREQLPQLDADAFLMDGGLETTLVFHDGFDLPDFAAFTLVDDEQGREALARYYDHYRSSSTGRSARGATATGSTRR